MARPADPAGLEAFAELLEQGWGLDAIQTIILASDEYFARVGAANEAFLTALYRDVLGRVPDDSGRAAFGGALSGGVPRGDVAAAVLTSPESAGRLVHVFYRRFLGREADASGLAHFAVLLAQGLAIEQLIVEFASSAEYAAGS